MRITSQEEYGLRCILQLASRDNGSIARVKDIAQKEGLSSAYAEKLLRLLQKEGLVKSVRGVKGGYLLSREPSDISVGEVVKALGGILTMQGVCKRYTGKRNICVHIKNCSVKPVWGWIIRYVEDMLNKTSLSQLKEGKLL